jgi:hypothetical protein
LERTDAVDTGRGEGLTERAELYGDFVDIAIYYDTPYDKIQRHERNAKILDDRKVV